MKNRTVTLILLCLISISAHALERKKPLDFADPAKDHPISSYPGVVIEYYDISGDTGAELREEMHKKGPQDLHRRQRDALTFWNINWSWPKDGKGKPVFAKTEVVYDITVTLPRWTPGKNADPGLVSQWSKFLHAVMDHEFNHVSFAAKGAPKVEAAILKAAERNPSLTTKEAHKTARSVINQIQKQDAEYDHETESGRHEGVILPLG